MNRILTILSLLVLILASCKDPNAALNKVVKEMAAHKGFEYETVGLSADSSLQWARYEALKVQSSELELLNLCKHKSPVVRSYAFLGLVERKSSKVFDELTKHIHDIGEFDRTMGCMVDPCYVSDFYLEQVGYFPYITSSYTLTPQQREVIDSVMLFGSEITLRRPNYNQIQLRSRGYLLEHLQHKQIYYNRLRYIALAGVIEALPALSKFNNPNDVAIIRNVYETSGLIGEGFVFKAIAQFPHPDLFFIVEKEITNVLRHRDYYDPYSYRYYKALEQYKTPRSKELIAQMITKFGWRKSKNTN